MNKKLGELKVNKTADYYNELAKLLEEAGYVLVLECETTTDWYYVVAKKVEEYD